LAAKTQPKAKVQKASSPELKAKNKKKNEKKRRKRIGRENPWQT